MKAIKAFATFDENGHIILDDMQGIKNKKEKLLNISGSIGRIPVILQKQILYRLANFPTA